MQLVARPTKGINRLPNAVFDLTDLSLRLDGTAAMGFEGVYDYTV